MIDNQQYLFIVGVGRSGTSLLQSMFAAHSQVVALPETSFLRRYAFARPRAVEKIRSDEILQRIEGLSALTWSRQQKWQEAALTHYQSITQDRDGRIVLDKDPRLVEFIPQLIGSFKKVKIIHIYRDPRDVLLSKKKAAWSQGRSLLSYLVASRVQLIDAVDAEARCGISSVRYENLIKAPSLELKRLCEGLGIEFKEEMLSFEGAARKLVQPSELSWKKETFKPVISDNSNKWQGELTGVEALASVLIVRGFCRDRGYTFKMSDYPASVVLKAAFVAGAALLVSVAYRLVRRVKRSFPHV